MHFDFMDGKKGPLVSICCLVYNHEKYLREALDGFLMQKTNFSFEIVIHDDASTDSSAVIIKEYELKYPKLVKPLYQSINQKSIYKSGMNPRFNFSRAKGKYIAICEGDDYWTDHLKLQKQVDFLEVNEDYGICFHNVNEISSFRVERDKIIPNVKKNFIFNLPDYILSNKTATCSIIFKRKYINNLPSWFSKLPFGDLGIILWVMYNSNEKGMVLKDVMGTYRIHKGGVHGNLHNSKKGLINAYLQHIQFFKIIEREVLLENKFKKVIKRKYLNTYIILRSLYKSENNLYDYLITSILVYFYKFYLKCV